MSRVKRGTVSKRKHKRVLELTKGFRLGRSKNIKQAKEALLHGGKYAFAGRKQRKRDMRKMWIIQLGNAVRLEGNTYSKFINQMKVKGVVLDRKILADLAVNKPEEFKKVYSQIVG